MRNYASFGKRMLALFIDGLVLSVGCYFFIFIFGIWAYFSTGWLIAALYFILMEGSSMHATLGKKALGMIVIDENGNGITYGTATLRYIGKMISSLILGVGYLMAAFSDTVQTLHDKMSGTYVIEANAAVNYNNQISVPVLNGNVFLVGVAGEFAGKSFPVSNSGIMIGRDNVACQIIYSANAQGISRHHCMVQYNPQTRMFILNDMGSSYGTYNLSGTKVISGQPLALKSGERFYLGTKANMFEVRA